MLHEEVIDDICEGCNKTYCPLEEMLSHLKSIDLPRTSHCNGIDQSCSLKQAIKKRSLPERTLKQLKCLEKFKYEQSEQQKRDIGVSGAWEIWNGQGYGAAFALVYKDGVEHERLYQSTILRRRQLDYLKERMNTLIECIRDEDQPVMRESSKYFFEDEHRFASYIVPPAPSNNGYYRLYSHCFKIVAGNTPSSLQKIQPPQNGSVELGENLESDFRKIYSLYYQKIHSHQSPTPGGQSAFYEYPSLAEMQLKVA